MSYRNTIFILTLIFSLLAMQSVFANQIGLNFTEDAIGLLGDYEKTIELWEFSTDAQAQRSDSTSLIANASVQYNFADTFGIKPFASYNKDELGGNLDVGGVLNWRIGDFDISAGASFRGSDPVAGTGFDG